ncbi:hypothetical protein SUNI508_11606 [Seiridium unicorne]|uniref:Oxidoreductase-like domain-containing protein n=1 Tax=Seiridium unicorne TaxID=138068 RepID=A0ABR2UH06_9PEZI
MAPSTTPREAQQHSPTLARLLKSRLAPVRETALLNAAMGNDKPVKPAAGDCCGSSCNPCVMDLYREELKVWKECADYRASLSNAESGSSDSDSLATSTRNNGRVLEKMPGSFDW